MLAQVGGLLGQVGKNRPLAPRAFRRHGVPRRAGRRGDPADRSDRRVLRRVQRDDHGPSLPQGAARRDRCRRAASPVGTPVRSGGRGRTDRRGARGHGLPSDVCHPVSETGLKRLCDSFVHRGPRERRATLCRGWRCAARGTPWPPARPRCTSATRPPGSAELAGLFGRLGADPRGGTCVEVGCGPGRMTGALAERFDRVVALDVSPAMLEQARANVTAPNVELRRRLGRAARRRRGRERGRARLLPRPPAPALGAGRPLVPARVRPRARARRRGVRPGPRARRRARPRVARRPRPARPARPQARPRAPPSAATA